METPKDIQEEKRMREPLLASSTKGGLRTLPFIIANEGFENAASVGLQANMIIYLMKGYGMGMATGLYVINLWSAACNLTPVVGAFLADSYVGRFWMIGLGSIFSLLGMMLLWSTTIMVGTNAQCEEILSAPSKSCTSPTPLHLIVLFSSFGLMSISAGGIRASSLAFGADQLITKAAKTDQEEEMKESKSGGNDAFEGFFNWYFFVMFSAGLVAMTVLVYIQDHMGWRVGFGVPVLLMLLSAISFFVASPWYVKLEPMASLLTSFARVMAASWRNRRCRFSVEGGADKVYHVDEGSTLTQPSQGLRFLNKACLIAQDPKQDLTPYERGTVDTRNSCTVEQVEELKSLIKILPIWSTGIIYNANVNQQSLQVVQATFMDRHIPGTSFEIPASSLGIFIILSTILWIPLYDRVILATASRIRGKPVRLDIRARMGIGLLLSIVSMGVAALVEAIRRRDSPPSSSSSSSTTLMSALWLIPQVFLLGLAGAFLTIAQNEFFYMELPSSMSSIASCLYRLGSCIASLLASLFVSVVDKVTRNGEKGVSWVASDPNEGHYDYYYLILACLSVLNYLYFLVCRKAYEKKGNLPL